MHKRKTSGLYKIGSFFLNNLKPPDRRSVFLFHMSFFFICLYYGYFLIQFIFMSFSHIFHFIFFFLNKIVENFYKGRYNKKQ